MISKKEPSSQKYGSFHEYWQHESSRGRAELRDKLDIERKELEIKEKKQNLKINNSRENFKQRLELERIRTLREIEARRISQLNQNPIRPQAFSRQQQFLRSLFGHGDRVIFNSPDSECRTQINGAIINNKINGYPIGEDTTADSFGFGYQRKKTGEMFGF